MRCYTYQADTGTLTEGIALAGHEDFGLSVTLGAEGRGNVVSRISLDKKFPPVLDGNTLFTSGFKAVTLQPKRVGRYVTDDVLLAVEEDGSAIALDHAGNTVILSAEGDSLHITKG